MDVVLNWGQEREYYVAGDNMACNPILKEYYSYYFVVLGVLSERITNKTFSKYGYARGK